MYKIVLTLIITVCFSSYVFAQSAVTAVGNNNTNAAVNEQFAPNEEADNPAKL